MSTTYEMKGKAKKFIAKIFDLQVPQKRPETPERPLPELPSEPRAQQQQLVDSFGSLRLSDESDPGFVGGFFPNATTGPGRLPRPPAMQMPVPYAPQQSLTMQYALMPPKLDPSLRPNSAPDVNHSTYLVSPSKPSTPQILPPKRPRASSTPPSPVTTQAGDQTQCAGITKAGKRCTRLVKNGGPALLGFCPGDETIERFCFQHAKELLVPTGFYARKKTASGGASEWVDFVDYIPPYLHPDTQVALRVEMEKLRSKGDELGWIYCYEIREPDSPKPKAVIKSLPDPILFKVGRTVNLVKRLHQWGKQCESKEQVLRGWFPAQEGEEDSLMKGRVQTEGQGVWCHRLERLIHLELADLAINTPYLQHRWKSFVKGKGRGKAQKSYFDSINASLIPASPGKKSQSTSPGKARRKGSDASSNTGASPVRTPFIVNGLGNYNVGEPCSDCGSVHKEIFSFARVQNGPYKGREWEGIVKSVIDGWGKFVEEYV